MSIVKKIYQQFVISNIQVTNIEPDVDKWFHLLNGLKQPEDSFDIAFNKYICRCDYFPIWKRIILNFAAFFASIAALPRLLSTNSSLKSVPSQKLIIERVHNLDYEDVIPLALYDEFKNVKEVTDSCVKYGVLCVEARKLYIGAVKRHPFHFYLNYWILKELSIHSRYLSQENPVATAVYVNERNIASPIIRELYETNGREFISFMHGDYLLHLIQAFFSFSRYYVWDDSYIEMFSKDLRCNVGKYIVYKPVKLSKKWDLEKYNPEYDLTYYFSDESESSIRCLSAIFYQLKNNGIKIKVRPHPRFPNIRRINKYLDFLYIEDCNSVSLKESLKNTEYVVGIKTTVLSEALTEGKKIILDDLSNPKMFNNLQRRKFVILNKEYIKLSEYISQIK